MFRLCTCYWNCDPKPPKSLLVRKCNDGLGLCGNGYDDACCNAKCAAKYKDGIGYCSAVGGTPYTYCYCKHVCNKSVTPLMGI